MLVPGGVKTFFFKLHTYTLSVKMCMLERFIFAVECRMFSVKNQKMLNTLDCWYAIFFWDVLQRTLKKRPPDRVMWNSFS